MTFEEWWKNRPVTESHFYWDKVEAKKAWEAATLAERELCAKLCEPQSNFDDPLTAWTIARMIRESK